ncbi:MAG: hypothetical protein KGN84_15650, partial [Acidobacteriota bacterium]|nr:hypothetical protein [Acidobacteriota bacterium]
MAGRAVVPTSLGPLVLDSGAEKVTLFNEASRGPVRTMFTMTGPVAVGMSVRRLAIGSRTFWRGEAVTLPRAVEEGPAGLMPVNLFRAVYVSNSAGYVILR